MAGGALFSIAEIEPRLCDLVSEQLGIDRAEVHPQLRMIQDLNLDSLDVVELFLEIEEQFDVDLPGVPTDPVYKAVFTRDPMRLSDLAELVYLRQGVRRRDTEAARRWSEPPVARGVACRPFTQLDGR
jgi:acyl carrier protein